MQMPLRIMIPIPLPPSTYYYDLDYNFRFRPTKRGVLLLIEAPGSIVEDWKINSSCSGSKN